jgi:aminoglycoside 2'-N-acetyltransferase I
VNVLRHLTSGEFTAEELGELRHLFAMTWPDDWTDDDWEHAFGGLHFIVEDDAGLVAHASVVERELHTNGFVLRTGYVEAVATRPLCQRQGHGSTVMRAAGNHIDEHFQLGALDTGSPAFYARLGWTRWAGPTWVRTRDGRVRTAEEDGNVLVRRTPTTPELDLSAAISCEWRPGDVW